MYSYNDQGLRVKRCPKCGESKDETLWNFKDKGHKRLSTYCKACDRVRKTLAARERFKDREKRKQENHRQRLWKYGLKPEQYEQMLMDAQNACEICSSTENLVIDHCHDSDKVRGILCWSCNVALGHFKDSLETVKKATDYLCKHSNKSQNS
jgi:hypothetical protein